MMDVYDAIRRRRMVRNYAVEPVEEAALFRILEATRQAPSAGFSQGVSLVVVSDPTTRTSLAELADEAEYVAMGFDPWISAAPVHVVVCVREETYRERYREPDKLQPGEEEQEWPVPYWWVDAGAALQNLLLAATAEGLATGFLGVHSLAGLRALLDIPADVAPIGIVTLGHAAPDRRSGSLRRGWKPLDEVVHRERW